MANDQLIEDAKALFKRIRPLTGRLDRAIEEFLAAEERFTHQRHDDDPELAAENRRHDEATLAISRRRLEEAVAALKSELPVSARARHQPWFATSSFRERVRALGFAHHTHALDLYHSFLQLYGSTPEGLWGRGASWSTWRPTLGGCQVVAPASPAR